MFIFWKVVCMVTFGFCFCPALTCATESNESLKFFAIGDWGGIPIWPYKTPTQIAVSERMAAIANNVKINFVLSLGDNFYFHGVTNDADKRFKETYENVFNDSCLQIPWYVIAGNHDHYGNVSAQVAYSKLSKRWMFPDYYYKKSFVIPMSKMTVDIVMIDTVILCGNVDPDDTSKQPQLSKQDKYASERQWEWLINTLNESNAHYLLVAGHFPVYSIGDHGSTKCLVERLAPLLEKYRVNVYFSGHDHNIQHIQPQGLKWQVEYIVSGATDFIDASKKHINSIPPGSLKYHWGHFFSLGAICYVEIMPTKMTVFFLDSSGKLLYMYSSVPRLTRTSLKKGS